MTNLISSLPKGVFEFVQNLMPDLLPMLPSFLDSIFNVDSIIMETTPRQFLFDGIHFCQSQDELAQVVCQLIAGNAPSTIKPNGDGSLRFSLFGHVSTDRGNSNLSFHDINFRPPLESRQSRWNIRYGDWRGGHLQDRSHLVLGRKDPAQ